MEGQDRKTSHGLFFCNTPNLSCITLRQETCLTALLYEIGSVKSLVKEECKDLVMDFLKCHP